MTETRAPNAERGELSLLLAGRPMGLRPSYEAIVAIEATLGRGLVDVARAAIDAKLSLGETAQIVAECVRAWGREVEDKDAAGAQAPRIGRLILAAPGGFHEVQRILSGLLSMAVTGGYDPEGNVKPAATMTDGAVPAAG
jgi:hypothetical protein